MVRRCWAGPQIAEETVLGTNPGTVVFLTNGCGAVSSHFLKTSAGNNECMSVSSNILLQFAHLLELNVNKRIKTPWGASECFQHKYVDISPYLLYNPQYIP